MRGTAVSSHPSTSSNLILAALPRREAKELSDRCTVFELRYGAVLFEPGEQIKYVYFPLTGLISLLTPLTDEVSVEVGLVGNEGMAGISMLLDVPTSPVRGLVQGSGSALRMKASIFRDAIKHSPGLQRALNHYLYCLMAQVAQTAACNRHHDVEHRLARWLLMTQDRMHSDTFYLTQAFLAQMLGVRRVGVTSAAGLLRNKKVISYSRGNLAILDRPSLELASCRCYEAVNLLCARAA
jgi:CRP-like cAMP-binding protein